MTPAQVKAIIATIVFCMGPEPETEEEADVCPFTRAAAIAGEIYHHAELDEAGESCEMEKMTAPNTSEIKH